MRDKPKRVLIVTSSGGGGLLQAANAKSQEIRKMHPDATIFLRDVMKDWTWKQMGRFSVGLWNWAQRRGDVRAQSIMGSASHIIDWAFWPSIFFHSLRTLFKEDIDQVIDTQVMGTSAILKALRLFNRRRNKTVQLEKVLVDLPTKKATHFFMPIKSLNEKDRSLLKIVTIAPLLERGETEEQFWKKHCNISMRHLQYEDVYVRQAFRTFLHAKRPSGDFPIRIRYKNPEELQLISQSFKRSVNSAQIGDGEIRFSIGPTDRVFTILLGSQPAREATLNYVTRFIALAKEIPLKTPTHLFVFCSDHTIGKQTLLRSVSDAVMQESNYPQQLSIIPMSFQSDDTIAPLFFRSDMTCTRCGGQTAMELMATSRGQIWIHSEAKTAVLNNETLLAGIPGWESENAVYLQQKNGARLVTPESFSVYCRELLTAAVQAPTAAS